jgi:hypothetical protein
MRVQSNGGGGGRGGGAKPPEWVICFGVDCLGPWWIGSFMENPAFIGASLSDVRAIMTIMCVLMVELLYQAVMGPVPVLECLLLDVHGYQRLCPILSGIKWPRFLGILTLRSLARYWEPLGMDTGGLGAS